MPNYKMKYYPRHMKSLVIGIVSIFCVTVLLIHEATAEGNLARRAERLEVLEINAAKGFSIKNYLLETGKYYRWRIISDGRYEYSFVFPKLSRNAWIGQVVIEDKEVKPFGGIYSLEFDDEGEIDVYFLPIRPGKYEYYVENYRESGMLGEVVVK